MTFLVTKSGVSDFYIVSRNTDPLAPAQSHGFSSDDEDALTPSCLSILQGSTRHKRTLDDINSEPVVFGDVDGLEKMMRGTGCGGNSKEDEEADVEPAPRRRRNAISAFLDGFF